MNEIRDGHLDTLQPPDYPPQWPRRPDRGIDNAIARFGLIPFWAKDVRKIKLTYNAGSETVATAKPFQAAWKKAQHCIVPAEAQLWLSGFSPCQ